MCLGALWNWAQDETVGEIWAQQEESNWTEKAKKEDFLFDCGQLWANMPLSPPKQRVLLRSRWWGISLSALFKQRVLLRSRWWGISLSAPFKQRVLLRSRWWDNPWSKHLVKVNSIFLTCFWSIFFVWHYLHKFRIKIQLQEYIW